MTREETIKLIGIITMAYPNFDKFKDEKQIRSMVGVWADMFAEDDGRIVAIAIKQHISTSKWPPSIAEIREIMAGIQHPDIIPPDEAWVAVSKLLYTEGEYCHTDIHKILPAPIAEAVDAVGYGQLYALHVAYARGQSGKAGLDRVAFMQAYEAKIERQKQTAMLPGGLRKTIDSAKESFSDGSRKMLESLNRRHDEKKGLYANWGLPKRLALDEPDDITEALEERQMQAIEAAHQERYEQEDEQYD